MRDPYYAGKLELLPRQTIVRFGSSSSFEAAVIRILLGTADVVDESGSLVLEQRQNYFVLGCPVVRVRKESGVRRELAKVDLAWKSIDGHLRRTLSHQSYFKEVAIEVVEFFVRNQQGAHTLAFLHIYRLLERISFVFPLLFAARSTNYPGVFATLKEYFKSGVDGELSLLRKFQEQSIKDAVKKVPVVLDFSAMGAVFGEKGYAVAKRCIPEADVLSSQSPQLEVNSQALLSLLISVRNYYFHFSVSNASNVSIGELGNSDEFFRVINGPIMNWLGHLYLEVLLERVS